MAILKHAKFRVLSAHSGASALKLSSETDSVIDLLLFDVDMPLMSGPELGQTLKKTRPDIHVMLMSGGSKGSLLVLNYGWAFIEKPSLPVKLTQMVSDVLHSPDRSQLGGKEFDSRKDILRVNSANVTNSSAPNGLKAVIGKRCCVINAAHETILS